MFYAEKHISHKYLYQIKKDATEYLMEYIKTKKAQKNPDYTGSKPNNEILPS